MKSLRVKKHWSQEQLAQLSGLNVRTIQRVEKGESVGIESLKALAAVFEISTDALIQSIKDQGLPPESVQDNTRIDDTEREKAREKAKSIKYFYLSSTFLTAIFVLFMVPNYNDGENLGPLIVVFISFVILICGHAITVFQPFGASWENKKISHILEQERNNNQSDKS
ncbi:XRE family transcriptional regulator [Alteromonas sediminis]|uniref:XRE family transcriptional regulator n=1 Tax=Alteromonas sediminis TaxID=2259342 RepID=UPI00140499DF|nr:XRE family transcriptional regulator [Alteromonas sediminis]